MSVSLIDEIAHHLFDQCKNISTQSHLNRNICDFPVTTLSTVSMAVRAALRQQLDQLSLPCASTSPSSQQNPPSSPGSMSGDNAPRFATQLDQLHYQLEPIIATLSLQLYDYFIAPETFNFLYVCGKSSSVSSFLSLLEQDLNRLFQDTFVLLLPLISSHKTNDNKHSSDEMNSTSLPNNHISLEQQSGDQSPSYHHLLHWNQLWSIFMLLLKPYELLLPMAAFFHFRLSRFTSSYDMPDNDTIYNSGSQNVDVGLSPDTFFSKFAASSDILLNSPSSNDDDDDSHDHETTQNIPSLDNLTVQHLHRWMSQKRTTWNALVGECGVHHHAPFFIAQLRHDLVHALHLTAQYTIERLHCQNIFNIDIHVQKTLLEHTHRVFPIPFETWNSMMKNHALKKRYLLHYNGDDDDDNEQTNEQTNKADVSETPSSSSSFLSTVSPQINTQEQQQHHHHHNHLDNQVIITTVLQFVHSVFLFGLGETAQTLVPAIINAELREYLIAIASLPFWSHSLLVRALAFLDMCLSPFIFLMFGFPHPLIWSPMCSQSSQMLFPFTLPSHSIYLAFLPLDHRQQQQHSDTTSKQQLLSSVHLPSSQLFISLVSNPSFLALNQCFVQCQRELLTMVFRCHLSHISLLIQYFPITTPALLDIRFISTCPQYFIRDYLSLASQFFQQHIFATSHSLFPFSLLPTLVSSSLASISQTNSSQLSSELSHSSPSSPSSPSSHQPGMFHLTSHCFSSSSSSFSSPSSLFGSSHLHTSVHAGGDHSSSHIAAPTTTPSPAPPLPAELSSFFYDELFICLRSYFSSQLALPTTSITHILSQYLNLIRTCLVIDSHGEILRTGTALVAKYMQNQPLLSHAVVQTLLGHVKQDISLPTMAFLLAHGSLLSQELTSLILIPPRPVHLSIHSTAQLLNHAPLLVISDIFLIRFQSLATAFSLTFLQHLRATSLLFISGFVVPSSSPSSSPSSLAAAAAASFTQTDGSTSRRFSHMDVATSSQSKQSQRTPLMRRVATPSHASTPFQSPPPLCIIDPTTLSPFSLRTVGTLNGFNLSSNNLHASEPSPPHDAMASPHHAFFSSQSQITSPQSPSPSVQLFPLISLLHVDYCSSSWCTPQALQHILSFTLSFPLHVDQNKLLTHLEPNSSSSAAASSSSSSSSTSLIVPRKDHTLAPFPSEMILNFHPNSLSFLSRFCLILLQRLVVFRQLIAKQATPHLDAIVLTSSLCSLSTLTPITARPSFTTSARPIHASSSNATSNLLSGAGDPSAPSYSPDSIVAIDHAHLTADDGVHSDIEEEGETSDVSVEGGNEPVTSVDWRPAFQPNIISRLQSSYNEGNNAEQRGNYSSTDTLHQSHNVINPASSWRYLALFPQLDNFTAKSTTRRNIASNILHLVPHSLHSRANNSKYKNNHLNNQMQDISTFTPIVQDSNVLAQNSHVITNSSTPVAQALSPLQLNASRFDYAVILSEVVPIESGDNGLQLGRYHVIWNEIACSLLRIAFSRADYQTNGFEQFLESCMYRWAPVQLQSALVVMNDIHQSKLFHQYVLLLQSRVFAPRGGAKIRVSPVVPFLSSQNLWPSSWPTLSFFTSSIFLTARLQTLLLEPPLTNDGKDDVHSLHNSIHPPTPTSSSNSSSPSPISNVEKWIGAPPALLRGSFQPDPTFKTFHDTKMLHITAHNYNQNYQQRSHWANLGCNPAMLYQYVLIDTSQTDNDSSPVLAPPSIHIPENIRCGLDALEIAYGRYTQNNHELSFQAHLGVVEMDIEHSAGPLSGTTLHVTCSPILSSVLYCFSRPETDDNSDQIDMTSKRVTSFETEQKQHAENVHHEDNQSLSRIILSVQDIASIVHISPLRALQSLQFWANLQCLETLPNQFYASWD